MMAIQRVFDPHKMPPLGKPNEAAAFGNERCFADLSRGERGSFDSLSKSKFLGQPPSVACQFCCVFS